MPLVGYMKTQDPGRISSITNLDGDKGRRKRIQPIALFSNEMYVTMYVVDCSSHEPPGAVVPVMLKVFHSSTGWKELGVAQCCPLCWRIIRPPVGIDLPEPIEPMIEKQSKPGGSRLRIKKIAQRQRMTTSTTSQHLEKIMLLATQKKMLTVKDVMSLLGLARTGSVKYLYWLVKQKKLIKEQSLGGRGNLSVYRLP